MTTVAGNQHPPVLDGFDPLSEEFARDPYPILERARRECPVFYHPASDIWFVARYDDVETVLRDFEAFSSRAFGAVAPPPELAQAVPKNLMGHAFIALDPPEHTAARKKANTWFTRSRMEQMEGPIRASANELIDRFAGAGRCELMHDYCYALTLRGIVRLLGLPEEDIPLFAQWTEDMFVIMSPTKPGEGPDSKERPISDEERRERWGRIADGRGYYEAIARQRRQEPREDLITEMVVATRDDGQPLMEMEEIVTHVMELVAAGTDTTATLMGHMVLFFSEAPEQLAAALGDPDVMANAVEEGLRRRGSSPMNFRVTTRDVELSGVTIPAGSVVAAMFASAGHDEAHYPEPRVFDVHRRNADTHLSLGKGRHLCMGAPLARLGARVGLQTLYERLPDLQVVPGQRLEYEPTYTTVILKRLDVRWTPTSA
jgi:cytochrome P450